MTRAQLRNLAICKAAWNLVLSRPEQRLDGMQRRTYSGGGFTILYTECAPEYALLDIWHSSSKHKVASFRLFREGLPHTVSVKTKTLDAWLPELFELAAPSVAAELQDLHHLSDHTVVAGHA